MIIPGYDFIREFSCSVKKKWEQNAVIEFNEKFCETMTRGVVLLIKQKC